MAQQIIYVPGFGDHNNQPQLHFLKRWRQYGVEVHFQQVNWTDEEPFESKKQRIINAIDELAKQGSVSLVGVSAGASLVLSAYVTRKEKIERLVFICGKLQNPGGVNGSYFKKNPAFRESVFSAPANLQTLTDQDKAKMLTIHAFIDTVVPVSNSKIAGVRDKTIPAVGHILSIFLALTLYAKSITKFLTSAEVKA